MLASVVIGMVIVGLWDVILPSKYSDLSFYTVVQTFNFNDDWNSMPNSDLIAELVPSALSLSTQNFSSSDIMAIPTDESADMGGWTHEHIPYGAWISMGVIALAVCQMVQGNGPEKIVGDDTDDTDDIYASIRPVGAWASIASVNSGVDLSSVDSGQEVASTDSGVDIASADSGLDAVSMNPDDGAVSMDPEKGAISKNSDLDAVVTDLGCTAYADAERLSARMTVASFKETVKAVDRGNEGTTPCIGFQYGPRNCGSIPRCLSRVMFQTPVIGRSRTGKAGPTSRQYGGIKIISCSIKSVNSSNSTERSQDSIDDMEASLALYEHLKLRRRNNAGSATSDPATSDPATPYSDTSDPATPYSDTSDSATPDSATPDSATSDGHSFCNEIDADFCSKPDLVLVAPGVTDAVVSLDVLGAIQAGGMADSSDTTDASDTTSNTKITDHSQPSGVSINTLLFQHIAQDPPVAVDELTAADAGTDADADSEDWVLVGPDGMALGAPKFQERVSNGKPTYASSATAGRRIRAARSSRGSRWR
ncbi:hypothetical protein GGI23_004928 [Coemansia sp. RSA 2559]|nr:hypothetical protein GGI23_004928 [Coemansia sp. RSA 2559]